MFMGCWEKMIKDMNFKGDPDSYCSSVFDQLFDFEPATSYLWASVHSYMKNDSTVFYLLNGEDEMNNGVEAFGMAPGS